MSIFATVATGFRIWTTVKPIRRVRKWRNKRRARKGLDPLLDKETDDMSPYNKLIGSVLGAVIGLVVARFPFLSFLAEPEVIAQVTMVVGAMLGTYFMPKNA